MDVEPVDITADLAGGYRPPERRRGPGVVGARGARIGARGSRLRLLMVRRRLRRRRGPLPKRQRLLAVATVSVLAAGVAAVPLVPVPPTPQQLLARSYAALLRAGSASFTLTVQSDPADGSVTSDSPQSGVGMLDLDRGVFAQTVAAPRGGLQEVRNTRKTYLKNGEDQEWFSVGNADLDVSGVSEGNLATAIGGPAVLLATLPAVTKVHEGARDAVGGVSCRHVIGSQTGSAAISSLGRVFDAAASIVVTSTVDACLDAKGRPVEVVARFAVLAPAASEIDPVHTVVDVRLTRIGDPVTVSLPPPTLVVPLDG